MPQPREAALQLLSQRRKEASSKPPTGSLALLPPDVQTAVWRAVFREVPREIRRIIEGDSQNTQSTGRLQEPWDESARYRMLVRWNRGVSGVWVDSAGVLHNDMSTPRGSTWQRVPTGKRVRLVLEGDVLLGIVAHGDFSRAVLTCGSGDAVRLPCSGGVPLFLPCSGDPWHVQVFEALQLTGFASAD